MKVGEILKDRISELKKDKLLYIANPKYWYRLMYTDEQLEFNKKLYFDLVTIPSWRGKRQSAKDKQNNITL